MVEMKNRFIVVFIGLLGFFAPLVAPAQAEYSEGDHVEIETTEGNKLIGTVESIDKEVLLLKTESMGTVTLQKAKVKRLKRLNTENFVNGQYWFDPPNRTRYFLGPTALSLKKGEGFYQNIQLFYNGVGYGFTDHFSVAAGGNFLIPGTRFFLVNPQLAFPVSEIIHAGVGTTLFLLPNEEFSAFLYGVLTVGTPKANFSVNLGYGYNEDNFADVPFISLSGQIRFAKNFAFVTENFLIPSSNNDLVLGTYGLRFLSPKVNIDFGMLLIPNIGEFFTLGIPFITLALPFGNR